MGVRTSLLALTFPAATVAQAEKLGIDLPSCMAALELHCQDMNKLMNDLSTDVFTPAGDTTNASSMTTQISALT